MSAHEAHRNASGRFTIGWVIALAAPLLWMVVALLHPEEPQDGDRWLFVHYAQLVLTPFLAFAVWRLLDGIRSTAATISRVALAAWMIFFSAYDATAGVATGLLARHADNLSGRADGCQLGRRLAAQRRPAARRRSLAGGHANDRLAHVGDRGRDRSPSSRRSMGGGRLPRPLRAFRLPRQLSRCHRARVLPRRGGALDASPWR